MLSILIKAEFKFLVYFNLLIENFLDYDGNVQNQKKKNLKMDLQKQKFQVSFFSKLFKKLITTDLIKTQFKGCRR
jgi:hypothetical protein